MSIKVSVNTFRPICFTLEKYSRDTCDLCSCSLYEFPPQSEHQKGRIIVIEKDGNLFHKDCEKLLEEYLKKKNTTPKSTSNPQPVAEIDDIDDIDDIDGE